ncbi:murein L,D-transpeptidase catalytic domain-containing protein [uncultured Roseibium sp.]|uniref:murein L,D-transpeptidase catalytic domain-containing protein n=1 Tax=uncultured Roseibium sp. TaxID=1936171 RepID=UPI0026085A9B|nr:murein L,D-transpeptidase catalytic domain family protein [uncultured Roseibium sp.]
MEGSHFSLLENVPIIVLAAGHGGTDPGAVYGQHNERDQVIQIVERMAKLLRSWGVRVEVAPHSHDTHQTIPHINSLYGFGDAWVIEVHRDSASGLSNDDASRRCGCYYGTSLGSRLIGEFVRDSMKGHGAHSNTWARPDTASNFNSLAWIRQTNQLAHLLELGFMQGSNSNAHLMFLAEIGAKALFEAFTGREANENAITESTLETSVPRVYSSYVSESALSRGSFAAEAPEQLNAMLDAKRSLEAAISALAKQHKAEPPFSMIARQAYSAEEAILPSSADYAPLAESRDNQNDEEVLRSLARAHGILPAVEQMIAMRNSSFPHSRPRYWGVVNFSRHSSKKRLYVLNVSEENVKSYLCSHGIGSDGSKDDGIAEKFSNKSGSHCTSLGIYRCAETYMGSNGYSMRLDGLEHTNSNARERFIVMHGAHYVSKKYIKKHGRIGRSEGCPALDHKFSTKVIDQLKFGSFLNHWTK